MASVADIPNPELVRIGLDTCGSLVPMPLSSPSSETSGDGNDWQTIFYGMGAGAGSLIVVAVLYTLCKATTSSTTRQTRSV
ncbi:leucine-rich repeat domain, L domain-like protein [Artemisia annua]|uniref:Leucine-rich repeat domain, L domain-like protein n=1 Tax=Artemisia annua TaxID=35608 RepID=A0A2U1L6F5_ARTAN|nr:leucine-rich repeat domain, L domain-like protein [Artemisia annua]